MKNEITYTQQGDFLLPCLIVPKQPTVEIGIWVRRHERYLKQHHKLLYFNLLTSCCVSRSENRSCTGFEPHSRRSPNRTCAAHLTAHGLPDIISTAHIV